MPLYTSAQAAEITKIGQSTLRKYVKQFKPYFSDNAKKPRGRRYTRQDVLTILKIKRLFAEGFDRKGVAARLDVVDDADFEDFAELLPDITAPAKEAQKTALALKDQFEKYQEVTDNKMDALADRQLKTEKQIEAWLEYQKALAKWESLGYFERRRTPKPKPPE